MRAEATKSMKSNLSKFYYAAESSSDWLSPEILSLFIFHDIRNLSKTEEMHIIESMVSVAVIIDFPFAKCVCSFKLN